jgi:hypothetical protein
MYCPYLAVQSRDSPSSGSPRAHYQPRISPKLMSRPTSAATPDALTNGWRQTFNFFSQLNVALKLRKNGGDPWSPLEPSGAHRGRLWSPLEPTVDASGAHRGGLWSPRWRPLEPTVEASGAHGGGLWSPRWTHRGGLWRPPWTHHGTTVALARLTVDPPRSHRGHSI